MRIIFNLLWVFVALSCKPKIVDGNVAGNENLNAATNTDGIEITLSNSCEILDGKVYIFMPPSADSSQMFTLNFNCHQNSLAGTLTGPELEGEHGTWYYSANVGHFVIKDSSLVSFTVVPGELYESPIIPGITTDERKSFGRSRFESNYDGKFFNVDSLILHCKSEYQECYTSQPMVFKLRNP